MNNSPYIEYIVYIPNAVLPGKTWNRVNPTMMMKINKTTFY